MLTSYLSFIQNIPEGDKMELASQLAHSMFKVGTIFYLVSVGRGDTLASSNPFKERETWKIKSETLKMRRINL